MPYHKHLMIIYQMKIKFKMKMKTLYKKINLKNKYKYMRFLQEKQN